MNADEICAAAIRLPHDQREAYIVLATGGDERLRAQVHERLAAQVDPPRSAHVRRWAQVAGLCAALALLAAALTYSVLATREARRQADEAQEGQARAEAAAQRERERASDADDAAAYHRRAAAEADRRAAEAAAQWEQRLAEAEEAAVRSAQFEAQALKRLKELAKAQEAIEGASAEPLAERFAELFAAVGEGTFDKPDADVRRLLLERLVVLAQRLGELEPIQAGQHSRLQHGLGMALMGLGDSANALPLLTVPIDPAAASRRGEQASNAKLRFWQAHAYLQEGDVFAAEPLLREIVASLHPRGGPPSPEYLQHATALASCLCATSRVEEALPLLEDAIAGYVARDDLGAAVNVAVFMGQVMIRDGRADEGLGVLEEAVRHICAEESSDPVQKELWFCILSDCYVNLGRIEQALFLRRNHFQQALAANGWRDDAAQASGLRLAGLGTTLAMVALNSPCAVLTLAWQDAPDQSLSIELLVEATRFANALYEAQAPEAALLLLRQVYVAYLVGMGPDFIFTRDASRLLTRWHLEQGRAEIALPALHAEMRSLESDPNALAGYVADLQQGMQRVAADPEALPSIEQARRCAFRDFPVGHLWPLMMTSWLAHCHRLRGEVAAETALMEELAECLRERLGSAHVRTHLQQIQLAELYYRIGRLDEAIDVAQPSGRFLLNYYSPADYRTPRALEYLSILYFEGGQPQLAVRLLEAVAQTRLCQPRRRLMYRAMLAQAYARLGERTKARGLVQETLATGRQALPADSGDFAQLQARLADALIATGAYEEGAELLRASLQICERGPNPGNLKSVAQVTLGEALLRQRRYFEAERLLEDGFRGIGEEPLDVQPWAYERQRTACRLLAEVANQRGDKVRAAQWRDAWNALHPINTVGPVGKP